MTTINVTEYSAWFTVQTNHGSKLEFVLAAADQRKGNARDNFHVYTTYTDQLYNAITKEFDKRKTIKVLRIEEYGDISIEIASESITTLEKALCMCEKVTQIWITKYKINKMLFC